MNRKPLTDAILAALAGSAGVSGSAQLVKIFEDGLGQVLTYPYYLIRQEHSRLYVREFLEFHEYLNNFEGGDFYITPYPKPTRY